MPTENSETIRDLRYELDKYRTICAYTGMLLMEALQALPVERREAILESTYDEFHNLIDHPARSRLSFNTATAHRITALGFPLRCSEVAEALANAAHESVSGQELAVVDTALVPLCPWHGDTLRQGRCTICDTQFPYCYFDTNDAAIGACEVWLSEDVLE